MHRRSRSSSHFPPTPIPSPSPRCSSRSGSRPASTRPSTTKLASAFIADVVVGKYQVALFSIYNSPDPDSYNLFWSSTNIHPYGEISINFTRFTTPQMDKDLAVGRGNPDFDARKLAYDDLVKQINDNAVNIWTIYSTSSIIADKDIHGLQQASEVPFSSVPITWLGDLWVSTLAMTAPRADGAPISYAPGTFSDVDASGQAAEHAAYLDRLADLFADLRRSWLSHLDVRPGEVVLDAGSGMGEVTRALATMVAPAGRAVGVDLSADLVERATERAASTPGVEYRVGDVTNLPFEGAAFDVAYLRARVPAPRRSREGDGRTVPRAATRWSTGAIDPDFTRSAQDADDSKVSDILQRSRAACGGEPELGRSCGRRWCARGFVEVAIHPTLLVTTDAERFRFLSPRSIEERLNDLVGTGDLARERADAFVADQAQRIANGTLPRCDTAVLRLRHEAPRDGLAGFRPTTAVLDALPAKEKAQRYDELERRGGARAGRRQDHRQRFSSGSLPHNIGHIPGIGVCPMRHPSFGVQSTRLEDRLREAIPTGQETDHAKDVFARDATSALRCWRWASWAPCSPCCRSPAAPCRAPARRRPPPLAR